MNRNLVEAVFTQKAVFKAVQDMAATSTVLLPERKHVEFVVTHQRNRRPGIAHGTHQVQRFAYLGAAVYVIAQEYYRPFTARIPERTFGLHIAQLLQQGAEFIAVPVNIADKIKGIIHAL